MARRARPRGHIEERANGKFRAIVYAGKDPLTGKPRYLKETADDEGQAEIELTKLLNQVDEQQHPRSKILVRQVIDKWFDVVEHEEGTRIRNKQLVRDYIDPAFGSEQASKLDAELIETFYGRLKRCRKMCTGRARTTDHTCVPLSNSSVRQIHAILKGALDRAVRWQYISINPAALAEPPGITLPEPDPPSAEEAAALLNEAWESPAWGMLLWLVMVTGCRRGELCALRWTDIDMTRGAVMVARSVRRGPQGIKEKRTKSSQKRKLSVDSYTVELMQAYRAACEEQCRRLGTRLSRTAFVFSNSPGFSEPTKPDTVTQRYRRLARRNKLRSTRFHALRHYSATELLTAGVDLRTVSGRLGHGSGATTLRFYAAWVNEADSRAADAIAKVIPRPDPSLRAPRSPYEQLAATLRQAIERGEHPVGTPLPPTTELATQHNVSVGTVSRAVAILKSAGLVDASRGRRATVIAAQ